MVARTHLSVTLYLHFPFQRFAAKRYFFTPLSVKYYFEFNFLHNATSNLGVQRNAKTMSLDETHSWSGCFVKLLFFFPPTIPPHFLARTRVAKTQYKIYYPSYYCWQRLKEARSNRLLVSAGWTL